MTRCQDPVFFRREDCNFCCNRFHHHNSRSLSPPKNKNFCLGQSRNIVKTNWLDCTSSLTYLPLSDPNNNCGGAKSNTFEMQFSSRTENCISFRDWTQETERNSPYFAACHVEVFVLYWTAEKPYKQMAVMGSSLEPNVMHGHVGSNVVEGGGGELTAHNSGDANSA